MKGKYVSQGVENMPTLKVLMLTHSAGFKHDCLPAAEKSIRELGKKSGVYEATVVIVMRKKEVRLI